MDGGRWTTLRSSPVRRLSSIVYRRFSKGDEQMLPARLHLPYDAPDDRMPCRRALNLLHARLEPRDHTPDQRPPQRCRRPKDGIALRHQFLRPRTTDDRQPSQNYPDSGIDRLLALRYDRSLRLYAWRASLDQPRGATAARA